VNTTLRGLRLNEVLARNDSAVPVGSRYPDLIELLNAGPGTLDLAGMSLTDDADDRRKFVFPSGTTLGAGQFLVLYADNQTTPPGLHLGFALKQEGDDLHLFDTNGQLLDSVAFGPQLADLSIGRLDDGSWALTEPTFGGANVAAHTGDPEMLVINEWLAAGLSPITEDFVELLNPGSLPVDLGGLYLTDVPESNPARHRIAPLSYIPARGFAVYLADGHEENGPLHLNFRLQAEGGLIALFNRDLTLIDCVLYGSQTNNVSQGRSPDGSSRLACTFVEEIPIFNCCLALVAPTNSTRVSSSASSSDISKLCVARYNRTSSASRPFAP